MSSDIKIWPAYFRQPVDLEWLVILGFDYYGHFSFAKWVVFWQIDVQVKLMIAGDDYFRGYGIHGAPFLDCHGFWDYTMPL
jgi:hypothetical protein